MRIAFLMIMIIVFVAGCSSSGTDFEEPAPANEQENNTLQEQEPDPSPEPQGPVCGDSICNAEELESCKDDCPECDDSRNYTKDYFDIELQECVNRQTQLFCGDGFCSPDEKCEEDCPVKPSKLSAYPYPFVHGNEMIAEVIVGNEGSQKEVSAAIKISEGLGSSELPSLVSESGSIKNRFSILVGNPCNNQLIAELMPYEDDCLEDFTEGEAVISIFVTGSSEGRDTYSLVVAGYPDDVARAGEMLNDYDRHRSKLIGYTAKV